MKNRLSLIVFVVATAAACYATLRLPLNYVSRITLDSSPVYSAKLSLVRESASTTLLMLDTQGQAVSTAHIDFLSANTTVTPLIPCTISSTLALRCQFNQTAQQQLIALARIHDLTNDLQILPTSSVQSKEHERLRQFPLLSPPQ